ncbi:hypothetical protein [Cypionkella sinensis]
MPHPRPAPDDPANDGPDGTASWWILPTILGGTAFWAALLYSLFT